MTAWFFLGVLLVYTGFSPLTIQGMGYAPENVRAAEILIERTARAVGIRSDAPDLFIPRHGLLEPALQAPFVVAGRVAFGRSPVALDRWMSLEPVVFSALLCTIVFAWSWRITGSAMWGLIIGALAAFTTIIWPYAYIGLETTQSVFLMLAGYLVLSRDRGSSWLTVLAIAFSCAVAVSVKSSGVNLAPAITCLVAAYWYWQWSGGPSRLAHLIPKAATMIVIIVGIYALNAHLQHLSQLSPSSGAGLWAGFRAFQARGPLVAAFNTIGLLISPNKGFLVYAPLAFVVLASLRTVLRRDTAVGVFALLALAGPVAGSAQLIFWTDETWGPRLLHAAVAPLAVALALTRRERPWKLRREIPLATFAVIGATISLLGTLFYYGSLHVALTSARENTLETLQYDPAWNPIRFHAVLLFTWLEGKPERGVAVLWPPARTRWFPDPGQAIAERAPRAIDIGVFAHPQPYLLRPRSSAAKALQTLCLTLLLLGVVLLVVLWLRLRSSSAAHRAGSQSASVPSAERGSQSGSGDV